MPDTPSPPDGRPGPTELEGEGMTWIHLAEPSAEEIEKLGRRFGWHPLDVEDVVSPRERPKVEEYPDYLFAVLHFPAYERAAGRITAIKLSVFLGPNYLVTFAEVELLPVGRLFRLCADDPELRDRLFTVAARVLYELMDNLVDTCFGILDNLGRRVDGLESAVFEGGGSDAVVRDMFVLRREIISVWSIMSPERAVLPMLARQVERFVPEADNVFFADIVDAADVLVRTLERQHETVDALIQTNESLIQHRLSDILRVLTMFTAVLLPLSFVAALAALDFHQNLFVSLPGGFYDVLVAMAVIVVTMVVVFKRKGWL
jgi:magnesium transporter